MWLFKKHKKGENVQGQFQHCVRLYPDEEAALRAAMKMTGCGIRGTIAAALKFYVKKCKEP